MLKEMFWLRLSLDPSHGLSPLLQPDGAQILQAYEIFAMGHELMVGCGWLQGPECSYPRKAGASNELASGLLTYGSPVTQEAAALLLAPALA